MTVPARLPRLAAVLLMTATLVTASQGASPSLAAASTSPSADDAPYLQLPAPGVNWFTSGEDDAIMVSRATSAAGSTTTVLVARADAFADSLSSAGGQALRAVGGEEAPLLLVPSSYDVPDATLEEVKRLAGSKAATIVILGGPRAVPESSAQQFRDAGHRVERVAGPGRHETAVLAARRFFPTGADTVVLARAFGREDNPTAGFADSIAAGAYAAEVGAPVLLTNTDKGNDATLAWLREFGPARIVVAGGPGAVSERAAQQALAAARAKNPAAVLQRVAGKSRTETAVAFARLRGHTTAAGADGLVAIDGFSPDGWWTGFTTALHAARTGSPVVLVGTQGPDAATKAFIGTSRSAPDGYRVVCGTVDAVCRELANDVMKPDYTVDCDTPITLEWGSTTYQGCDTTIAGLRVRYFPPRNGAAATHIAPDFHGSSGCCFWGSQSAATALEWRDGAVPALFLSPRSPAADDGDLGCCHWIGIDREFPGATPRVARTIQALAKHFGVPASAPVMYSGASSGAVYLSANYLPHAQAGGLLPGAYAVKCGPAYGRFGSPSSTGNPDTWDPAARTSVRDRTHVLFLYGDQDYLYDGGEAMREYRAAGFDANEKVYPGGTHCEKEDPDDVRAFWDRHA